MDLGIHYVAVHVTSNGSDGNIMNVPIKDIHAVWPNATEVVGIIYPQGAFEEFVDVRLRNNGRNFYSRAVRFDRYGYEFPAGQRMRPGWIPDRGDGDPHYWFIGRITEEIRKEQQPDWYVTG